MTRQFQALIFSILLCLMSAAEAGSLIATRVWRSPTSTQVVFEFDGKMVFDHEMAEAPDRLVISILGAGASADALAADLANTVVSNIHSGRHGKDLVLVLGLREKSQYHIRQVPPAGTFGYRLIVVLEPESLVPEAATPPPEGPGRDIVVFIDPGHGGEDPGANRKGILEKDVVFQISQRIVQMFEAEKGFAGRLTRTGDYLLSLRSRTEIARNGGADFFASIHADTFRSRGPRGASVFVLSQEGATDEYGRILENVHIEADLLAGFESRQTHVQKAILDLMLEGQMNQSANAAVKVIDRLAHVSHMHARRVLRGNFAVLKTPNVPSLLIEAGFLSNTTDQRLLSDPAHQEKMARAIFEGIKTYLEHNPPEDSWVYRQMEGGNIRTGRQSEVPETL
jgi:N-acetylmuramoyl-L-alanine amidase